MKMLELKIKPIRLNDLVVLVLCLLCLTPVIYNLSLKANDRLFQPYALGDEERQAMEWIIDNYNMSELLFLSMPPGWETRKANPDYVRWIVYMLKPYKNDVEIYIGSIFDLIENLPSYPIPNLPAFQGTPSFKWPLDRDVVTISTSYAHTFYKIDDVEKLIFTEVHENVYQVKKDADAETLKDLAALYRGETVSNPELKITSLPSEIDLWQEVGGFASKDLNGVHLFPDGTKMTVDCNPYMHVDFHFDFDLQQEWYIGLNISMSGGKFGFDFWNGSEKTGWLWNLESEMWQYHLIHLNPLIRNSNTLTRLSIVVIREDVSAFSNSFFMAIYKLPSFFKQT